MVLQGSDHFVSPVNGIASLGDWFRFLIFVLVIGAVEAIDLLALNVLEDVQLFGVEGQLGLA